MIQEKLIMIIVIVIVIRQAGSGKQAMFLSAENNTNKVALWFYVVNSAVNCIQLRCTSLSHMGLVTRLFKPSSIG